MDVGFRSKTDAREDVVTNVVYFQVQEPKTLPTLFLTAPVRIWPPMPPIPRFHAPPVTLFAHFCFASRSLSFVKGKFETKCQDTHAYVKPMTFVMLNTKASTTIGIKLE